MLSHGDQPGRSGAAQRAATRRRPGQARYSGSSAPAKVLEIGEGVSRVAAGDEVCALLGRRRLRGRGGGAGGAGAARAGWIEHDVQAAALPEVFATAYLNLFMEARAGLGETVLLHAGASGVGTAAIQLCRLRGNPCFVTAGNPEKIDRCIALGAEGGWNRHDGSFVDPVKAWAAAAVWT